ncbi:TraE/TraK family type IV conjugative transfer system protein [Pseudomonas oryzihabitans]|uniref:TraE/TraK family type IV conjugative transfer system protein n=1 Tax=Pseudomonas oryzihabitans TaxID=47885 RepID=UPI0025552253|nr:TraE/TraK family type IV conjugative transfer system protein [Pseudomonas oryzihabitans]MDK8264826.1 TraE/TraK family type IV conjugative transfer system protein [Pseudomonas oryzihabitans]
MLSGKFKNTYRGAMSENAFLRKVVVALILVEVLTVIGWLRKSTVVDMQPPTLAERAWVDQDRASDSYVSAWALYIADRLGNVNPKSAEIIKATLEPLLANDIYQDVLNKIDSQVHQIRQDRVTLEFEPRQVLQDKQEPTKYFIVGKSKMTGPSGQPKQLDMTYEIELKIKNYKPVIAFLSVYEGAPRTEEVRNREAKSADTRKRLEQQRNEN